jgi:transposase
MRYELTDQEWAAIKPMLPNKPRGVARVNDRRVLNGIFWVLRSGAPWRDLPDSLGPYTTCYNRFVRWRRAGVWAKIMDALARAHDASVQMIDTSIVRVHQHGACITRNRRQSMGRSRGGLTSKIHAVVDTNGLPVRLALTAGRRRRRHLTTGAARQAGNIMVAVSKIYRYPIKGLSAQPLSSDPAGMPCRLRA